MIEVISEKDLVRLMRLKAEEEIYDLFLWNDGKFEFIDDELPTMEMIPLQVAVRGCVVNGPGEAREADLGSAGGRGKGHLFVKGHVVRVVPESEMVSALVDEAQKIMAEGIEARIAAAEAGAEEIAAAEREELVQFRGVDANGAAERVARIREMT